MSEISSEANPSSFVSSGEMKSFPFSNIITKMNEGNYEMWARQVKRTLIAHDKEHLILEPEPVQKVGKYTTWFKDNSLVMVWIVGTLSQEIANEVLHKESAKDMWDSLAATRLSRIPISASTVPDTTSSMLATRGRGGHFFARGRGGHGRGNTPSRPVCQFCHRIGHTVDKCWQKHGRPVFANQTVSTDSPEQPKPQPTASSSELRVDDIISQLRNSIGAPDPTTSTVTTAASASSSGMYSAYTVCPAIDTTDWLIDSGASTHLCGDKAQFTSYVPTPPGRSKSKDSKLASVFPYETERKKELWQFLKSNVVARSLADLQRERNRVVAVICQRIFSFR
ncbi:hypothetical protein EJ110_NYTH47483 [Nymphaea thermarum]|nr:hypothetical protein EJ110_NYTH47483 [Nymphaea thermarum]